MKSLEHSLAEYDHIIWDWNGTLLNDVKLCIDIVSGFLRESDLPSLDIQKYRRSFCFPIKEYYQRIGLTENFDQFNQRFIGEYKRRFHEVDLFQDAAHLLENMDKRGIGQSILSASQETMLIQQLEGFGLAGLFEFVCGLSDFSAHSKQNLGRHLMRMGGWHGEKVVLVGDTLHDLEVATELGLDAILLAGGHQCTTLLQQQATRVHNRKGIY